MGSYIVDMPNQYDILAILPNPGTAAAHAVVIGLAAIFTLVPGVGSMASEYINKFGAQYTTDSASRTKNWQKLASDKRLSDATAQAEAETYAQAKKATIAEKKKDAAIASKPLKEKEAKALAEAQKTNAAGKASADVTRAKGAAEAKKTESKGKVEIKKTTTEADAQVSVDEKKIRANKDNISKEAKSKKTVIDEQKELKNKQTTVEMRNKIQLAQKKHDYKLIETDLQTQSDMIKLKSVHLKTTDEITQEITAVTQEAHQGMASNITSSDIANAAIAQLNAAEKDLLDAHQELYKALDESQQATNAYQLQAANQFNTINQTTEQGRADIGKENTLAEKQFKTIATKAEIDTANGTKIIQAYLNVYKAEHNAQNKLDLRLVEATLKATLAEQEKTAITPILEKQLEARRTYLSVQMDQKLSKLDNVELKALSKVIEDKIEEQTQLIKARPQGATEYEATRSGLKEFAGQIDVIAKKNQEQTPEKTQDGLTY